MNSREARHVESYRRRVWLRIASVVIALPFSVTLLAAAIGSGALPLGALVLVSAAYLLVVLFADLKDAYSGGYRARPRYWIAWTVAVLPACAWLIWLWL